MIIDNISHGTIGIVCVLEHLDLVGSSVRKFVTKLSEQCVSSCVRSWEVLIKLVDFENEIFLTYLIGQILNFKHRTGQA